MKYTKNLSSHDFKTIHEKDSDRYYFSLNPSKEKNWSFSSPTRYLRSIRRNEIPIVFENLFANC